MADDPVNPRHYTDLTIQPIDVIEAWSLGFCLGSCLKYIARHEAKDGLQDLKKALWYLQRDIQRREKENGKVSGS
jgi:hypothetical protein